jgi:hypothetical protein
MGRIFRAESKTWRAGINIFDGNPLGCGKKIRAIHVTSTYSEIGKRIKRAVAGIINQAIN